MHLRYAFRRYPNGPRRAALARAFGRARVVFSDALRARGTARVAGLPFRTSGELSERPGPPCGPGRRAGWGARRPIGLLVCTVGLSAARCVRSATGRERSAAPPHRPPPPPFARH
ncbi:helix-turn-helix domain-containing protein [Streptomyces sp. CT34]|uniref:helix-turn-helix domain-containing protein n=1 Tax=Streptomyces sp. CT34 TaxID=1553907 RepID=UPI00099C1BC7